MARIYDAQIEWQAPSAHRFQAQPLQDYISSGLENVSRAADQVSRGIQTIKDKEAADKMAKAGEAAQIYLDNFQDFSGDNYMEKMESEAMAFWDEAYASLDPATKNRFEQNNPEARNIFNLKVKDAAVNKAYDHENEYWTRQLPSIANGIVSLGNPNKIKKALEDEIHRLTEGTGMRQKDAQVAVDKLTAYVGQGAIAQAIAEGRANDAAAMNNDKVLTAQLTPEQLAKNNNAIKQLRREQASVAKETDSEKVLRDALGKGFVLLYDQLYAGASNSENPEEARKQATTEYNKFLNDFLLGDLKDEYGGVPLASIIPEGIVLTNTPFSIRQKVVKDSVAATLENNPIDKEIKREIGYRAVSKAASLAKNGEEINLDDVKMEDIAEIGEILDQVQGYYGFDDGVQKSIDKLNNAYVNYLDRAEMALQFSAFEDENTLITERTGLGWGTQRYAQSGNITPATAKALSKGAYSDQKQGTVYSNEYKTAMDAGIQQFATWTNAGKLPESGTYKELLMQNAVNYYKMPLEDKKALGIESVTRRQVVENYLRQAREYDKLGLLDSQVGDTRSGVRPTSIKTTLKDMSDKEKEETINAVLDSKEGKAFIDEFRASHGGLHSDAIKKLKETEGNLDPKSVVGKKWVGEKNSFKSVVGKVKAPTPAGVAAAVLSPKYRAIKEDEVEQLNKDWQEQVIKPINNALVGDYAFRMTGANDSPLYNIISALGGGSQFSTNKPRIPISDAIQDTAYYSTFIDGVKELNRGANPNQEVAASYASANRSTSYKNWTNNVERGRVSNKARKADKETNAYTGPYSAGAYKIPVK